MQTIQCFSCLTKNYFSVLNKLRYFGHEYIPGAVIPKLATLKKYLMD